MRAALVAVLVALVPATQMPGKSLVLLVDVSGSMIAEGKLDAAMRLAGEIAQQPVDDGELLVVAFNDSPSIFPEGWIALPDMEAVKRADDWLRSWPGEGGTQAMPAFRRVLAEQKQNLSIIIVTDGEFPYERDDLVLSVVEVAQAQRVASGLGAATISVLGIGHTEPRFVLKRLGELYGGGYYVEEK